MENGRQNIRSCWSAMGVKRQKHYKGRYLQTHFSTQEVWRSMRRSSSLLDIASFPHSFPVSVFGGYSLKFEHSLYLFKYIQISIYVCTCVCVHSVVWGQAHMWKSENNLRIDPHLPLCWFSSTTLLEQSLFCVSWGMHQAVYPIPCLRLGFLRWNMCTRSPSWMWIMGIWIQVLQLVKQVYYLLSHLPRA